MMQFDTAVEQDRNKLTSELSRPIPETIRQAWGKDVAVDFVSWLAAILRDSLPPSVASSPHIQVTPAYARRQVNGLMLDRVSHLLLAGEPRLTYTDRWYWRVPVDLTFPSRGRVGSVGEVDVDATLGKVTFSDELLDQIARRADRLARAVLETPVVESTAKND